MSFRPSPIFFKQNSSSRAWLSRQSRDPYVKQRLSHPAAYRSRSAFKLLELDLKWGGFLSKTDVRNVVDLGAAPGGWSQVVAGKMGWTQSDDLMSTQSVLSVDDHKRVGMTPSERKGKAKEMSSWSTSERAHGPHSDNLALVDRPAGRGTIIAVDILPISPIPGVHTLQVDFLSPRALDLIMAMLTSEENPLGMVDIILSDMAANFSGNKIRDTEASLDICHAVFSFAKQKLMPMDKLSGQRGGTLLLKHFTHPLLQEFRAEYLQPNFRQVLYIKPEASRSDSAEGYWLCRGWKGTDVR